MKNSNFNFLKKSVKNRVLKEMEKMDVVRNIKQRVENGLVQLQVFFGDVTSGYIAIWNKETKKTAFVPCEDLEEAARISIDQSEEVDIHLGICLLDSKPLKGRGMAKDVSYVPALWLDVDIGSEGHSSDRYPPTLEESMEIIDTFPLQPTIINNSGNGLHAYWVFDRCFHIENEIDRSRITGLSHRFHKFFADAAATKGYKLDKTGDLTRLLRLCGTLNHKQGEIKLVEEVEFHGDDENYFYSVEQIEAALEEYDRSNPDNCMTYDNTISTSMNDVIKKCRWAKHCKTDSNVLSEPEWYHMLTLVSRCSNSEDMAKLLSKNYPGYAWEETKDKLEHAAAAPGPTTCRYINESFLKGSSSGKKESYCKACKYFGSITSPIQLGVKRAASEETARDEPPRAAIYKEWVDALKPTPYTINSKGFLTLNDPDEPDAPNLKISNFVAKPVKEITLDNGIETEKIFVLSGLLDGKEMPEVEVSAIEFSRMEWILRSWGIEANVMPFRDAREHLRSSIQTLGKHAAKEKVYTHIGWRKIDGKWCYLHAGGCIGSPDITVKTDSFLDSYRFQEVECPVDECVHESFELLDIAEHHVTLPLLAATYLAPLNHAFKESNLEPSFLLWLHGTTGTRKTSLATLFLAHFKEYSKSAPATFKDTANAIEKKAFLVKDSILLIDDYHPGSTKYDQSKMDQTAQHLIRLYGDKIGKGRMKADTSMRKSYPPRGLALVTGEDMITGHSSQARCFPLELKADDIDLKELSDAQANSTKLSGAMQGYLEWLAPQLDTLSIQLKDEFIQLRDTTISPLQHGRSSEMVAWLQVGFTMFLKYAVSLNLVTDEDADEWSEYSWGVLNEVVAEMKCRLEAERPELIFGELLTAVLASRECCVLPLKERGSGIELETIKHIGWEDAEHYFLIPDMAYASVCKQMESQGGNFSTTLSTLLKHLDEADLIMTETEKSGRVRRRLRRTIRGKQYRVIVLKKKKLITMLELDKVA
jgi:hypothetical protein